MAKIEMEMPKSCWDCPLQVGSNMDEYCAFLKISTWEYINGRHKKCPLKECE